VVVYIEDNRSNVHLMERLLALRPGIELVHAADGWTGLTLVRARRPDLVLLDLHLPGLHGEEVLRRLWEDPATRRVPVAVLSADATPAQKRRLLAAGAIAYLTKPFDIADVLHLVDEILASPTRDVRMGSALAGGPP
jgi:CheY-like chemotaxis protein